MEDLDKRSTIMIVFVAALGYFVDVYDLILFSVLRIPSLKDLGVQGDELLNSGVFLLNMQMAGLLSGGILWGIWGDKRGRVSVLFGSILLYSLANIANATVQTVEGYAIWRFIAGVGLAGELGAGITLVSEVMSKEGRGLGTTLVAAIGVGGAVAAALVGNDFYWRTAYYIGGGLGLCLLVLRVSVYESGMFKAALGEDIQRGNLVMLLSSKERAFKYLCCFLVGVPIWYVVGILITLSPELGKALEMPELPVVSNAVLYSYLGLVVGDLVSGLLSQLLRSRRKVLAIFVLLTMLSSVMFVDNHGASLSRFYLFCFLVGFPAGYWAVFVTTASEQFGTNLRATVTTTAPNFVRGAVLPITTLFQYLRSDFGVLNSALAVGALCCSLALISVLGIQESFGKDLDYVEK
ncbi:MAG: MFS transporter [Oligoflexia bacterium]|nr:MFS transporter [Oligoflexia bacterium]